VEPAGWDHTYYAGSNRDIHLELEFGESSLLLHRDHSNSDQRTGKPYTLEFTASRDLRTQVSTLVQQLNFFRGQYNIRQNPDPRVVSRSLSYSEGVSRTRIIYTSTNDRRIRRLTDLFENISSTVNDRRRLGTLRSRDPNSLEPALRRLDTENKRGRLVEPQILMPALQQIASDANAPPAARQEAASMLHEIAAR
jgi:hypothetical protein